jgi:hypothetical protein
VQTEFIRVSFQILLLRTLEGSCEQVTFVFNKRRGLELLLSTNKDGGYCREDADTYNNGMRIQLKSIIRCPI